MSDTIKPQYSAKYLEAWELYRKSEWRADTLSTEQISALCEDESTRVTLISWLMKEVKSPKDSAAVESPSPARIEAEREIRGIVEATTSALDTGRSEAFLEKFWAKEPSYSQRIATATALQALFFGLHHTTELVQQVRDENKALRDELEQRQYQGVWRGDTTYAKHASVTRQGSTWISRIDGNRTMPGAPPYDHWQLSCKAGKDGRDGKDGKDGKDAVTS